MTNLKKKYIITNILFGDMYTDIFTNQHLKSISDDSNLPKMSKNYDIEYRMYIDKHNFQIVENNPYIKKLSEHIYFEFQVADALEKNWKYESRYGVLEDTLIDGLKYAIEKNALFSPLCADLVVAKNFFPEIIKKIEEGYDSVNVLPMRTASEPMVQLLNPHDTALDAIDLFEYGYACLHPLWGACHWDAPQFSKMPICFIWNAYPGMLVRSFSISPTIFIPNKKMLKCKMIDMDVLQFLEKPFIAKDWTDCPIINVEPIRCFYPAFENIKANSLNYAKLLSRKFVSKLHKAQLPYVNDKLYYPNKDYVKISSHKIKQSDEVVKTLLENCSDQKKVS
tara:strand:- start:994 stop:2004 length:1011 start_codon:yes stop_codon:yes gene_type:complete